MLPSLRAVRCSFRAVSGTLLAMTVSGLVDLPAHCAGQHYALVVGVREYDRTQLNSLTFTENDATGAGRGAPTDRISRSRTSC